MSIDRIQLLRNVGQFDNVSSGAGLPFGKLTVLYGENGRGKTTLAAILRSLATNDAVPINERQRLGAQHPPHIIINRSQAAANVFQNGGWNSSSSDITVFDDEFVAQNVCSGLEIDTAHRQNLHELILGSQGVQLNTAMLERIADVEQHIRLLRERADAIPVTMRSSLTVEQFCLLQNDPDVDNKIDDVARQLAAARSADEVQGQGGFLPPTLPSFDVDELQTLLHRNLADLEATAAVNVQEHFARLGAGGEAWVSQGMPRIAAASAGADHEVCPFCTQSLAASKMISHYRAYFSAEYQTLKNDIAQAITRLNSAHAGDNPAAFERGIATAVQTSSFWKRFSDSIPEINVDTAAVVRAWTAARQAVLALLHEKQASPLETVQVSEGVLQALKAYEDQRLRIAEISIGLQTANGEIALVKERAAGANIAALNADVQRLGLVKTRHSEPAIGLCAAYLAEKQSKTQTEQLRDQARSALEQYRLTVFPAYQTAINSYLQRFNAGFRIGAVSSVNNRNGSSANYNVVINENPVILSAQQGPSFRNTLSAGDRNTLALAFFFASLDRDPAIANKIVVIDDPMTSLDEHRSLTTVHEMRLLCARVSQMIVLSHSKPFLLGVWSNADRAGTKAAVRVARQGPGSTLIAWDVNRDSVTEHDRRHALVSNYISNGGPATEREAAQALRPILEGFLRVAFPADYTPEKMLGPFVQLCRQRLGTGNELLNQADVAELDALREYGNRFHHDSNDGWQTAVINDQELMAFCHRTLLFARR